MESAEDIRKFFEDVQKINDAWRNFIPWGKNPEGAMPVRCHTCRWSGKLDDCFGTYSAVQTASAVRDVFLCPNCMSRDLEPMGDRDIDLILDALNEFGEDRIDVTRADVRSWYCRRMAMEVKNELKSDAGGTIAG